MAVAETYTATEVSDRGLTPELSRAERGLSKPIIDQVAVVSKKP